MRFPSAFLDEIKARIPASQIVGRRVKLKREGRIWVGRCCFHSEKTASLKVYDQGEKGPHYHCFGCGEHGDIFAFIQATEGKTFVEAVEQLAGSAGLSVPSLDPQFIRREAKRLECIEALEEECTAYQTALRSNPDARAYLMARKVSPASSERFRLGWAGDGYFRGRLTFPISDVRGRVVGFGGRCLADDAKPKYLNSVDSEVFQKGSFLYNHHHARQPAHDGSPLVAVEGYTAAIAADAAGFPATVATLGTSVGERHLTSLWTMSPEPIFCFDADTAGRRAARRAIDLAVPMLLPGRTLKFVFLPSGMDPDDMVRQRGPEAFKAAVGASVGLADAVWRLTTYDRSAGTPEALAGLEQELVDLLRQIPDRQLRQKYIADMRDRVRSLPKRRSVVRANGHSLHSTNPGSIRLTYGVSRPPMALTDALCLAAMVSSPQAGLQAAEAIAANDGLSEHTRQVASEILLLIAALPEIDTAGLMSEIQYKGLGSTIEQAISSCRSAGVPLVETGSDPLLALQVLRG